MTATKSWTLTLPNSLPLTLIPTPPNKRGNCWKCHLEKEIRLISQRPLWIGSTPTYEERKFCWGHALDNLYELEYGDYEFKNKKGIVKEIRAVLMKNHSEVEFKEKDHGKL